jgi:hypothetical protein
LKISWPGISVQSSILGVSSLLFKSVNKLLISIGMFLGSTIGSYVPLLWGGSLFLVTSILFSVIGGLLGIWLGYRTSKYLGFM